MTPRAKQQKKKTNKVPKLSNKLLQEDPMKTRRKNKAAMPRPNNQKKRKMSENDATKGILINTVSRQIGKDPNGSDVFTQYVITTKVLEDALAEKIVKPLAERVSLFTEYTTKYTEKTKNRTKEVIR
jgi:hypothetical protein